MVHPSVNLWFVLLTTHAKTKGTPRKKGNQKTMSNFMNLNQVYPLPRLFRLLVYFVGGFPNTLHHIRSWLRAQSCKLFKYCKQRGPRGGGVGEMWPREGDFPPPPWFRNLIYRFANNIIISAGSTWLNTRSIKFWFIRFWSCLNRKENIGRKVRFLTLCFFRFFIII